MKGLKKNLEFHFQKIELFSTSDRVAKIVFFSSLNMVLGIPMVIEFQNGNGYFLEYFLLENILK